MSSKPRIGAESDAQSGIALTELRRIADEIAQPASCIAASHVFLQDQLDLLSRFSVAVKTASNLRAIQMAWGAYCGHGFSPECKHALSNSIDSIEQIRALVSELRVMLQPENMARTIAQFAAMDAAQTTQVTKCNILCIDDEPRLLRMYKQWFSSDSYNVALADNARSAIDVISEHDDFDVVICDLDMPELNGRDLYKEVCDKHPALQDAFVFVSGCGFDSPYESFLRSVSNPVFMKPISKEDLQASIKELRHK